MILNVHLLRWCVQTDKKITHNLCWFVSSHANNNSCTELQNGGRCLTFCIVAVPNWLASCSYWRYPPFLRASFSSSSSSSPNTYTLMVSSSGSWCELQFSAIGLNCCTTPVLTTRTAIHHILSTRITEALYYTRPIVKWQKHAVGTDTHWFAQSSVFRGVTSTQNLLQSTLNYQHITTVNKSTNTHRWRHNWGRTTCACWRRITTHSLIFNLHWIKGALFVCFSFWLRVLD